MPKAKVHHVMVFAESEKPEFKACLYSYYVAKKFHAQNHFQKEFPGRKILKVADLGMQEIEFSPEKYRALYEDT
jgi:hypothetical protein